jgi:hypothetical protein
MREGLPTTSRDLAAIVAEAQRIVARALGGAGSA